MATMMAVDDEDSEVDGDGVMDDVDGNGATGGAMGYDDDDYMAKGDDDDDQQRRRQRWRRRDG